MEPRPQTTHWLHQAQLDTRLPVGQFRDNLGEFLGSPRALGALPPGLTVAVSRGWEAGVTRSCHSREPHADTGRHELITQNAEGPSSSTQQGPGHAISRDGVTFRFKTAALHLSIPKK